MGLGYYGAWLLYGFMLNTDIISSKDDGLYINGQLYEAEDCISIHEFGDDDTDGYFLSWGKSDSFHGGQISFEVIKMIYDSYDEDKMKTFCQKYGIVYVIPSFNILLSNGQMKY